MKKEILSVVKTLFAAAVLCGAAMTSNSLSASEPKTLVSWEFDSEQDVKDWRVSNMTQPVFKDGAIKASATSWDPFFLSPHFMLKPQQGQYIEIRMSSKGAGVGEIFFASSDEGKYGGFSQEKTAQWLIRHDGEFHTYQIMPAWLSEPQIIKLRIDVGRPDENEVQAGADAVIDYIRIVDIGIDDSVEMGRTEWDAEALENLKSDASDTVNEWISGIGKLDPKTIGSNLYIEWQKIDGVVNDEPFARASMRCLTGTGSGQFSLEIPLFNLGAGTDVNKIQSKNVDLGAFASWGEPIYRWEFQLPKDMELKKVALTKDPVGKGAFETQDGRQSGLARLQKSGATVEYESIVRNCGGDALNSLSLAATADVSKLALAKVTLQKIDVDPLLGFNPTGDRNTVQKRASADQNTAVSVNADNNAVSFPNTLSLAPGEAFRIVSQYVVKEAGQFNVNLTLNADNAASIILPVALNVLPAAELPQNLDYVPAPQPVESDYEVGAFYFPGWSRSVNWEKIDAAAPVRKPLLGYYDESNPEVVDWQIKWAAENGISFFLVDWYWYHGEVRLEHWIRAFQKAKYRSNLKWAMMWANHTGFDTHSTEDWKVVTKYWIDNYFNTPEYYTIDGKPVVMIWQQEILDHDMIEEAKKEGVELKQGEGCKRAFEISRQMCVEAGFPGVYFVAMKWPEHSTDKKTIGDLANGGFDATTIYHFMYPGKTVKNPRLYSFDQVVEASKPNWQERYETGILPFMPNISTGWDSRPWHGFRNTVVYNRTTDSFRRLLEDYKSFADETGVKRVVLGPMNEWGEGSYIEPNNEFGFGMYEAIREILCKEPEGGFPVNYAPNEVGLGPYDYTAENQGK